MKIIKIASLILLLLLIVVLFPLNPYLSAFLAIIVGWSDRCRITANPQ